MKYIIFLFVVLSQVTAAQSLDSSTGYLPVIRTGNVYTVPVSFTQLGEYSGETHILEDSIQVEIAGLLVTDYVQLTYSNNGNYTFSEYTYPLSYGIWQNGLLTVMGTRERKVTYTIKRAN